VAVGGWRLAVGGWRFAWFSCFMCIPSNLLYTQVPPGGSLKGLPALLCASAACQRCVPTLCEAHFVCVLPANVFKASIQRVLFT
jgi:hypothetical protein